MTPQKICSKCNKPFISCPSPIKLHKSISSSSAGRPCALTKSCTSINTLKSFDQNTLRTTCSGTSSMHKQPSRCASKTQSKTCINCGGRIEDDVMPTHSTRPQSRSCKSSMSNQRASGKCSRPSSHSSYHNQEIARPRSKCSQLSHKQSVKSIAPCQSYDHCSTCNRIIFAACQSCTSLDVCTKCKNSVDNFSQNAQYATSRDLKGNLLYFLTAKIFFNFY